MIPGYNKGYEGGLSNYDFQKLLKEIDKGIKHLCCTLALPFLIVKNYTI
jgi:hypothetical protein